MKNIINISSSTWIGCLCLLATCLFMSCESAFEFELPEANSKIDTVLPEANFSYVPSPNDFTTVEFTNLSFESTKYLWDFGDGNTSAEVDPSFTFVGGEGTYPVTLTASDNNGATNSITIDVEVIDLFVPITPDVVNGDFEDGREGWEFESFSGGTTTSFNTSSDGSGLRYDGTETGTGKSGGAKWTMSTSAGAYLSSSTRYAYQPLVVSPNEEYILEYEYAIKNDGTQAPDGNRIVAGVLDGHFEDGADAIPSFDAAPLLNHVGNMDLGKGVFTKVELEFTSNASGEIAILIYSVTDVDSYLDNVKVYPK